MKIFKLPDLGEGLTEAEIVEWHIEPGDEVTADTPLISIETDKAIVDVPCPWTGKITRLLGKTGDIVEVGSPLVEFADGGHESADAGTVVGEVTSSDEKIDEKPSVVEIQEGVRVKATPAVRALAHRLDVELENVSPSGRNGTITVADVKRVSRRLKELGPPELLRGTRRAMAQSMTRAHAEVVPATIMDDADIEHWPQGTDISVRMVRAIASACKVEPALNAWYDAHSLSRRLLEKIDIAMAIDTPDGLFAPVLRDVSNRDDDDLRSGIDLLKKDVGNRSVQPDSLREFTITLSNYGTIAGRYGVPVVIPPSVAIVGCGRIEKRVVPVDNIPEIHQIMPITLTFDHRAVTGGEAGRFLNEIIKALEAYTS
jgi:pyruvate dehydrogenase E2 component (dihydrolipoamide acetyltransferase)